MKLERIGIIVGIVAGIVAIWYYLKGAQGPSLVTYPNTQSSGVPLDQNAATTYNIAGVSRAPDPSLIYGNPPPLPPTPAYQSYNYSPINMIGLTPQGAPLVTKPAEAGTPGTPKVGPGQADKNPDCCGGGGCGCGGCNAGGGVYGDGNGACLVANPSEQARAISSAQLGNLAANMASSAVGTEDQGLPNTPTVNATPSQSPAVPRVQTTAQSITPPSQAPPTPGGGFLPWAVAGKLLGLNGNSFAESWYEKAAGFTGNG